MRDAVHSRIGEILKSLKRLFRRETGPADDPYAYVGAPKGPKLPRRSAAASVEPE